MGSSGGSKTKSSQTANTTTRIELPVWYEGQLHSLTDRGANLLSARYGEAYPSMYVGMDPATTQGLSMVQGIAGEQGGSAVPRAAIGEWKKTVSGDYLRPESNPWLSEIARRAGYEAENRINSQYATGEGASGGAYANALADAQTQLRGTLYGDNYQAERARMQAALGMSPTMENLQYADAARLGMVGQRREEDALAKATEANRQYQKPWDEIARYSDLLYGNPAQRAVTASESGTKSEKTNQSNKFDWAAFVGGLLG